MLRAYQEHLTREPYLQSQVSRVVLGLRTCCMKCVSNPSHVSLQHAAGSQTEKKAVVDPIIQQLLKNARSEAVRQEFLSMAQEEYTSKHDIEVLVSPQFFLRNCSRVSELLM